MTASNCDLIRDLLPEFALGVIDGQQRAAVLDHLAGCAPCRHEAARLGATADALSVAAPGHEPPAGFEDRTLARLAAAQAEAPASTVRGLSPAGERRRSRLVLLGVAAAVVLFAVVAAASAVVVDRHNSHVTALAARTAPMVTAKGRTVGRLTVTGSPAAVLVTAPEWSHTGHDTYLMRVRLRSGRVIEYGEITLDDGYGGYGLPGVQVGDVKQVDMLVASGRVVCRATF